VNNQWGSITKNSGSNSKVKLWLQNNTDNNINIMTYTEDKSDEENANLLLGKNDLNIDWDNIVLKPAYTKPMPISEAKKNDLLFLLEKRIIPPEYTNYIKSIPSTSRPKGNSSDCE